MKLKMAVKTLVPDSFWQGLRTAKHVTWMLFRWMCERCGLVVALRSDYYSPLPSEFTLEQTKSRWAKPSALAGVTADMVDMKSYLLLLIDYFYDEFQELPAYEVLCRAGYGPGYPQVDAFTLYAFIRHLKPKRYIEVGSGLSTLYCDL